MVILHVKGSVLQVAVNGKWLNAMKHFRRVEGCNVLGDNNIDKMEKLTKKLMLPSLSRPSTEQLNGEVKLILKSF